MQALHRVAYHLFIHPQRSMRGEENTDNTKFRKSKLATNKQWTHDKSKLDNKPSIEN